MGAGEGTAGGDLPWPEAGSQSRGRNSWEQPGSERLLKKTSRARGAGLERGAGGKRRRGDVQERVDMVPFPPFWGVSVN